MFSESCSSVYESDDIRKITGNTIRPGGFRLTDKAVEICSFNKRAKVLDIGCGIGTTAAYLNKKYDFDSSGIDPSEKLLKEAEKLHSNIEILSGSGEQIPFQNNIFDAAFCECTMSLMDDKKKVIKEVDRILKDNGYLVISDVYARNTEKLERLKDFKLQSCIRGVHDIEELKGNLKNYFKIIYFEDYSNYLKEMLVKIIFEFGSMAVFWNKIGSCSIDSQKFKKVLADVKVGYFLLIAQKI